MDQFFVKYWLPMAGWGLAELTVADVEGGGVADEVEIGEEAATPAAAVCGVVLYWLNMFLFALR